MSFPLTAHNEPPVGKLLTPDMGSRQGGTTDSRVSASETFTQFRKQNRVTPEAAKLAQIAGRLNASRVTDAEYNELLEERRLLVDKELSGDLTRREQIHLTYVRWSLDRIEDARYGGSLDELETRVAQLEKFSEDVTQLHQHLDRFASRKR
jgi:hypothetical protein